MHPASCSKEGITFLKTKAPGCKCPACCCCKWWHQHYMTGLLCAPEAPWQAKCFPWQLCWPTQS